MTTSHTRKREHKELTEMSDIEDITDDVLFKKKQVNQQEPGHSMVQRSLYSYGWQQLDGLQWKKSRNGKQGGAIQQSHRQTNWYHPFLWTSIDAAAKKADWSSHQIVKTLQREQPTLFKNLNRGTVHRWLSKTGKGWTDCMLANVAN